MTDELAQEVHDRIIELGIVAEGRIVHPCVHTRLLRFLQLGELLVVRDIPPFSGAPGPFDIPSIPGKTVQTFQKKLVHNEGDVDWKVSYQSSTQPFFLHP